MLKLKLQYFGHLIQRAKSLEKTLMLGKTEGKRRRGWERMRWLDSITNSIDMNFNKLWQIVKKGSLVSCSPWDHRVRHDLATKQQQNTRINTKLQVLSHQLQGFQSGFCLFRICLTTKDKNDNVLENVKGNGAWLGILLPRCVVVIYVCLCLQ